MNNGQQLKCKVVKIESEKIIYFIRDSELEQSVSLDSVEKVIYENNRVVLVDQNATQQEINKTTNSEGEIQLVIRDKFVGFYYFKNGVFSSKEEVRDELSRYPDLRLKFNAGQTTYKTGVIVGSISGFILGYQIGKFINGFEWSNVNEKTFVLSGIFTITSIVASISGENKIKRATKDFNNRYNASLGFGPTPSGIGLSLQF